MESVVLLTVRAECGPDSLICVSAGYASSVSGSRSLVLVMCRSFNGGYDQFLYRGFGSHLSLFQYEPHDRQLYRWRRNGFWYRHAAAMPASSAARPVRPTGPSIPAGQLQNYQELLITVMIWILVPGNVSILLANRARLSTPSAWPVLPTDTLGLTLASAQPAIMDTADFGLSVMRPSPKSAATSLALVHPLR
jgi:hypothetical protein